MAKKKPIVYAFIDSQNLNMGVKSEGWRLDFRKFRQYLRQKYAVEKAYLCIGYVAGNETMYAKLQEYGFLLVFKPTLELPDGAVKGNVDAELVLHAMIQLPHYGKAVIVSGDGDFYCLVEYLESKGKLLRVLAPNKHFSGHLRKFNRYIVRVDLLKKSLALKKTEISGRSKP
jgi:uncharacterized LabA/DUF88 family protein